MLLCGFHWHSRYSMGISIHYFIILSVFCFLLSFSYAFTWVSILLDFLFTGLPLPVLPAFSHLHQSKGLNGVAQHWNSLAQFSWSLDLPVICLYKIKCMNAANSFVPCEHPVSRFLKMVRCSLTASSWYV